MIHHFDFSGQRLQVVGNLYYLSFIILSVLLAVLIRVYTCFLPHHKRPWIRNTYVMPAGPWGWPIVGSLVPWLRARNGGRMVPWLIEQAKHGEMTTLSMGSKTWVLLNTPRAVNEILSKRASSTHERPYFPIAGGLVSRNRRYFLLPSADLLDGRRLIHRLLLGGPSPSLEPIIPDDGPSFKSTDQIIQTASLSLLNSYLDEPQKWYQHNYRYPASIIYQMVTGTKLEKSTSELDDFQLVTSSFLTSMNSHFVDFFPQLATIVPVPLQFWRTKWLAMGQFHYAVMRRWWDVILCSPTNEQGSSFVQEVLESEYARNAGVIPTPPSGETTYSSNGRDTGKDQKDSMPLQEERAMYLTMFVLSAGADNPRMTLNAFIMACMAYPRVVRRAREDMDRLCGGPGGNKSEMRLPTLDDLPQLPFIAAVVKEVLRWRPTVPLMPQRVSVRDSDVNLDGVIYKFPQGTEFLVNTVAVCSHTSQTERSSEGYDSPEEFRPERWLETNTQTEAKTPRGLGGSYTGVDQDLWQFAFSAGRRSCSGYKLAQKELFLAVARLLFCFDFVAPGMEGKERIVNDKVLNAFSLGEPFPVEVKARSVQHENLIRALSERQRRGR